MNMGTLRTVSLLLLLLVTGASAKGSYSVVKTDSRVGFSLNHLTGRAKGIFKQFEGVLSFSPKNPDQSVVRFSVDVASVDTRNGSRDEHLRGDEYFGAVAHPKMTFESKAFKKVGDNRYMVTGPLVIKGVSKNVSVPVTLAKTASTWATGEETQRFKATFDIDRTEFGVGGSSALLGSTVTIELDLQFRGDK